MDNTVYKYPNTVKAARKAIWNAMTGGAGGGATVAIMEKGEVVYSECMGMANREEGRPVDRRTRFDVASTSKIFTTAAVLKLADIGKVDIDRPYHTYVTDFVMADPRYKAITPRMLFNHSSGLMGSCYNQSFVGEPHPGYKRHVLETLRRARLKHEPGVKSSYCNDGFTLCEILIERVSGVDYIDFLQEHILNPLELKDTGVSVGMCGSDNVAELYDSLTGNRAPREVSPGVGMGGISSTAEDLCRFGQSFCYNASQTVLSAESLGLMLTPQTSAFGGNLRTRQEDCHIGWDVVGMEKYEKIGVKIVMKGGLTWYSTKFAVLPELGISMALSFAGPGPSQKTALIILDALLEEKGCGSLRAPAKRVPSPQPVPPELRRFAGFYANGGTAVAAAIGKDNLTISAINREEPAVEFVYADGYFYKKNETVPHYFMEDKGMEFFVQEDEHCAELVYQRIPYQNAPKILDFDVDGKVWLCVNVDVSQSNWNDMFVVKSALIPQLPGYLDFAGIKLVENGRYASPAGTYFRDQKELELTGEGNDVTAYITDYILKSESIAAELVKGETRVTIPETGYGTLWHKTTEGFIIKVVADGGAVVWAAGLDGKKTIFFSVYQTDEFYAPAGSYLAVYGKRGGSAQISCR